MIGRRGSKIKIIPSSFRAGRAATASEAGGRQSSLTRDSAHVRLHVFITEPNMPQPRIGRKKGKKNTLEKSASSETYVFKFYVLRTAHGAFAPGF